MDIQDLINSGANALFVVKANDLRDFAETLVERTRMDLTRELAEERNEVYYSSDQVVAMLSISKMTLWRWNKDGYLKHVRVGALTRYRKSDIDKMLK